MICGGGAADIRRMELLYVLLAATTVTLTAWAKLLIADLARP